MPVINAKGISISYEEAGDGLPVVFIPGLTGTKEWFRYQFSGLSQSYRIISYDLRPAGKSGDYNLQILANDLSAFLNAIRAYNAVICGHSFGGLVALQFALSHPQQISALGLISSFATLPPEQPSRILSWLMPRGGGAAGGWIARLLSLAGKHAEAGSYEWLEEHAAKVNRATIDARLQITQSVDLTGRLPEIAVPALIAAGARDREEIIHAAQALYENIPDSSLEVIEGGDHFCFFSRHDLVNTVLDDFLVSHLASLR